MLWKIRVIALNLLLTVLLLTDIIDDITCKGSLMRVQYPKGERPFPYSVCLDFESLHWQTCIRNA